jgi:hypothetical protein
MCCPSDTTQSYLRTTYSCSHDDACAHTQYHRYYRTKTYLCEVHGEPGYPSEYYECDVHEDFCYDCM